MRQRWGGLLFLHWPVPAEILRPLVPFPLEIDTFDGTAWIGITPFSMWGIGPPGLPSLPGVSRSLEINVRTYVRLKEEPGVWFLSLDAQNPLVVWGARLGFRLPYFQSRMGMTEDGDRLHFAARRFPGPPPARFEASWRLGKELPLLEPGTLDFFLIERYLLFAGSSERLLKGRIRHPPWPLREAVLESFSSTLLASHGLPPESAPALLHAQAHPVKVWLWPPERVR